MQGCCIDSMVYFHGGPAHLQEYGFSEEHSFTTAPAPGSEAAVSLMAIADLGFCEGDGAMTWSGNYPNPIEVEPPGTEAEIRTEARHWRDSAPVCATEPCCTRQQPTILIVLP